MDPHAVCPVAAAPAVFVVYGTGHAGQSVGPTAPTLICVLYCCAAQDAHASVGSGENWPGAQTL